MKTHLSQFDVRENIASPRQHDLRIRTALPSRLVHTEERDLNTRISQPENESQATDYEIELYAAQRRAATGGRDTNQLLTVADVAEMLQVPVSWILTSLRLFFREPVTAQNSGSLFNGN
jgi:hypothetical protein